MTGAFVGAAGEKDARSALGDDDHASVELGIDLERAHQLALRREGHLAHAPEPGVARLGEFRLALGDEEGSVGGVAVHDPGAMFLPQRRVVGEAAPRQHGLDLGEQLTAGDWSTADEQLALGRITGTGDIDLATAGHDALDRHLVPGEGAGLVGTDHRGRAERLDRRQLLDDSAFARHALHAERQHHRQDRRQALGHRSNGE